MNQIQIAVLLELTSYQRERDKMNKPSHKCMLGGDKCYEGKSRSDGGGERTSSVLDMVVRKGSSEEITFELNLQ